MNQPVMFREGELVRCDHAHGQAGEAHLRQGFCYWVVDCWTDARDRTGPFVRLKGIEGQYSATRFTSVGQMPAVVEYEDAIRDLEAYESIAQEGQS